MMRSICPTCRRVVRGPTLRKTIAIGLAELYPSRTVAQIARAARLSWETTRQALTEAGVVMTPEHPPRLARSEWDRAPLGTDTDCTVARRLGVSRSRVQYQRVKRGIPAVEKGRRE